MRERDCSGHPGRSVGESRGGFNGSDVFGAAENSGGARYQFERQPQSFMERFHPKP